MVWKKKIKGISFLLSCIMCALLYAGCAKQTQKVGDDVFKIGIVTKAKDSEYWMSFISGIEMASKDYNVEVILLSPKSEREEKVQKKMIEDLLEKDIDAIAVSPINSYETAYIEKARRKKIPIYACDTNFFEGEIPYIGVDNYKLGVELAKEIKKGISGGGGIGIISGSLNQEGHKARVDGFTGYLAAFPDMDISFVMEGYSNVLLGEEQIKEMIDTHPDLKGIFVTNAVTALGISDYLVKQGNREILICAIDAQQDAYKAVRNGHILALANHSGYDNGYKTIERIVKETRDRKTVNDENYILNVDIITQENIEEYFPVEKEVKQNEEP